MSIKSIFLVFSVCIAIGGSLIAPANAQTPSPETAAPAEVSKDDLGRETPRGTLQGFMRSVGEQNYTEAAQYMNLAGLPRSQRENGEQLAQQLQNLLDRYGRMQADGALSDDVEGKKNDDLAADLDDIAALKIKDQDLPIYAQRITDGDGASIWLIDSAFVAQIPKLSENIEASFLDKLAGTKLDHYKIRGAGLAHWLCMIGLYLVGYMISGFIIRSILRIVRKILQKKNKKNAPSEDNIMDAFETPLRLFFMVLMAMIPAEILGVSILVRHTFLQVAIVISLVSFGLFVSGISDLLVSNFERSLSKRGRYNMTSALAFFRRGIKLLCAVIVIILILDSFGVDVTSGLAALGIGGIALALGAQKTLENFIGSVSIIVDQPFYVGDFCKIGDISGTIEDIGMRSTQIRTNDRTLVTIPNGNLSTLSVENYARRSRFLINRRMVLRYDSKPDQIHDFIDRSRAVIASHSKTVKDGIPVRLLGFVDNGYAVEIFCHVETADNNEFLSVQADITYGIIEAAWASGIYFAIPSQTFIPALDQTGGRQKQTE